MKLVVLILLAVYGWGAWKFWKGFSNTQYQPDLINRLGLTLLWPVLLAVNTSYRRNFQRALRGR